MNWLEFWNCFKVFIDSKETLSGAEKMYYLKNNLIGEARKAVEGQILSNKNYNKTVSILKKKFGDPLNLINSFYTELINLVPAISCSKSLRSLYDSIEKNLLSWESL